MSYPKVLVLREKHGDRYHHLPDESALWAVSLRILRERLAEGWWYVDDGGPAVRLATEISGAGDGRRAYRFLSRRDREQAVERRTAKPGVNVRHTDGADVPKRVRRGRAAVTDNSVAIDRARDEVVRAAVAWHAARVAKRGPYMAEADALEAAVAALAKLERS